MPAKKKKGTTVSKVAKVYHSDLMRADPYSPFRSSCLFCLVGLLLPHAIGDKISREDQCVYCKRLYYYLDVEINGIRLIPERNRWTTLLEEFL